MRSISFCLAAVLLGVSFPIAAHAALSCKDTPNMTQCPGKPCEMLGFSRVSDDQRNIIYCEKSDTSDTGMEWKSTIADVSCPAGQWITGIKNGMPQCGSILNLSCSPKKILVGISGGKPVCSFPPPPPCSTASCLSGFSEGVCIYKPKEHCGGFSWSTKGAATGVLVNNNGDPSCASVAGAHWLCTPNK